jgi:hypothetical protein
MPFVSVLKRSRSPSRNPPRSLLKTVGVNVHWVAQARRLEVAEVELPPHVVQKTVLDHQRKMFVDPLKRLNLVVQLYEDPARTAALIPPITDASGVCAHFRHTL